MADSLVFNPASGPMVYACGLSGSGTNYEKIYERDPNKMHLVFSNSPDCSGVKKARERGIPVVSLDSKKYFKDMWGIEKPPRYGIERNSFDMAMMTLVEQELKKSPDLICLAGYDLWIGDWMARRYFPRILNVHPGDAKKYTGLGWIPTAKAILKGEVSVKSTVFFVDESDDGGPILIQSRSLMLSDWGREVEKIRTFAEKYQIKDLNGFKETAKAYDYDIYALLVRVSKEIQERLKIEGDWKIYPFAVHDLIGKGRVGLKGRRVYIDGVEMPEEGWQVDKYGFAEKIV